MAPTLLEKHGSNLLSFFGTEKIRHFFSLALTRFFTGALSLGCGVAVIFFPHGPLSRPSDRFPNAIYESQDGYTQEPQNEREQVFEEVILVFPRLNTLDYQEQIVDQRLAREFRLRYQERFQNFYGLGREELILQQHTAYDQRVVEESARRREFADYMVKRLTEDHVDRFVRNEPSMRTVYEVKQKLENVEVKVTHQTKLNLNYSLTGNWFEMRLDNPSYWEEAKVIYRMNPRQFGPSTPLITEYRLSFRLSPRQSLRLLWENPVDALHVALNENLSPQFFTYYSFIWVRSAATRGQQVWVDPIHGQPDLRYMNPYTVSSGLGWSF
jgi:hypothetical protein